MTMRERMARAICERALAQTQMRLADKKEVYAPDKKQWQHMIKEWMRDSVMGTEFREQADAALAAMREPSDAMVEDGGYVLDDDVEGAGVVACKTFRKAWQAAIDAARNEEASDG